jgi:acetyltransferase-like isoleucine patch superfamily enzyme
MDWRRALSRARENPGMAIGLGRALLRGAYYRWKFRLLGRRVIIGRRFRVTGRLDIQGPGTVIFGDDCAVISSRLQITTPWTHSPDAMIRFGDRVLLTGTRIGCQRLVEVADGAGLSDARIMDTDFHSTAITGEPRHNTTGVAKPIRIRRNAWVGAGAFILKGSDIGENAVVSAGSVVASKVPPNVVVLGNPARVVWRLTPPAKADAPARPAGATTDGAAGADLSQSGIRSEAAR